MIGAAMIGAAMIGAAMIGAASMSGLAASMGNSAGAREVRAGCMFFSPSDKNAGVKSSRVANRTYVLTI